jgi:hypothetical protein
MPRPYGIGGGGGGGGEWNEIVDVSARSHLVGIGIDAPPQRKSGERKRTKIAAGTKSHSQWPFPYQKL